MVVAEGTLPNEGTAPKAGVGVVPLVEITGGANGFGGLLAPNANGVLLDVVVVVLAVGKLKPDDDDDELAPNRGADDDVVVVGVIDVDTRGKLLGNGNPLVAEAGNASDALVVVGGGTVTFELKPNKLGVVVVVVVAVVDDVGANDGVEAPAPKENSGGLPEDTAAELVATAVVVVAAPSGVVPNDPNVIVVGILIGDNVVVAVVDGAVKNEDAVDVVVAMVLVVVVDECVDIAEPNNGKLADALGLVWNRLAGVLVMVLSEGVVLVPNRGVAVTGNEILVVTGGLITVFSFVAVDGAPNKGKALVAGNAAVDVANGGMEKVLSLPIPIVGADIVTGANSFGIVD